MIEPLVIGVVFGFLLERGGLTRHERVVGVFRFTDLGMLKFLGSAIVVGAATAQAIVSLGFAASVAVVPTHLASQALGGLVFGAAMASVGFCPGTIFAGAGVGRLDALVPGVLGLLAGALVFGLAHPAGLGSVGDLGHATLPGLAGVSAWLLVLVMAEAAALGFYWLERGTR